MDYTGKELRRALLKSVATEWHRPVHSRDDADRVTEYFRGIGWGWAIDEHCPGDTYDESIRQSTDAPLDWCGIGPAWCAVHRVGFHLEAGQCVPVRLRPAIAQHVLPSTYRANSPEHWSRTEADPPAQVAPEDIEPGDLVTVITRGGKSYGDHFVVARRSPKDGELPTYEFNAYGELGDGRTGRGVVGKTRDLDDVRRVYRLDERHFEKGKI